MRVDTNKCQINDLSGRLYLKYYFYVTCRCQTDMKKVLVHVSQQPKRQSNMSDINPCLIYIQISPYIKHRWSSYTCVCDNGLNICSYVSFAVYIVYTKI